jgi:hypothetical protein
MQGVFDMTHITIERAKLEQWVKAVVSVARYAPAGEGVFSAVMMAQDDMNEVLKQARSASPVQDPTDVWFDKCFRSDPPTAQPAPTVVDCHATGVCVQSGLRAEKPAPVQLTDDVVQKIISKLEPLLDAKNQSWAEAERMLHGITEKGNT